MRKRILSLILTACMIFSLLPTAALADAAATSGKCGDNLTWSLDNGTLTVSGEGDMYVYGRWNTPWFDLNDSIEEVVIGEGVTSISYSAFEYCYNLYRATIPGSVKSIGEFAFRNCTYLGELSIGEGVESISYSAFENCYDLYRVTIPGSVKSIGASAFYGCHGLEKITLGEGVESIGSYAFGGCYWLEHILLPASIKSIGGYAFASSNLTDIEYAGTRAQWEQIDIDEDNYELLHRHIRCSDGYTVFKGTWGDNLSWKLDNGTLTISGKGEMEQASYYPWGEYYDIESVVIEEGVTSIAYRAFLDCGSIESVSLPAGLKSIGDYAFSWCHSLGSISLPVSIKSIGSGAFDECNGLTSVKYEGTTAQWKQIDLAEDNDELIYRAIRCSDGYTVATGTWSDNLTWKLDNGTLTVSGDGEMRNSFNYPWRINNSLIETVVIEEGVTRICYNAFAYCGNLKSVSLPGSLQRIGEYAFYKCSSLQSIELPNGLAEIGRYAFYECSALTEITIPGSVQSMGHHAFAENESLKSITIKDGVTGISYAAFEYASSLKTLNIPASVKSIADEAFYGCYALSNVNYSGTVDQWNEIYIGDYNDCLTENTIQCKDGKVYPHGECGDKVTWEFRDGTLIISGEGAIWDYGYTAPPWIGFSDEIINVVIENGITRISSSALSGCRALESINIPASVESIGRNVLYGRNSLKTINVDKDNAYFSTDDTGVLFDKDKTTLIAYPCGLENESYTVPDGVTSISYNAFESCTKLKSVTLSDSVKSIGDDAFYDCYNLESINISSGVEYIGTDALSVCVGLKEINVSENNEYYSSEDGVLFNKDKTVLILCPRANDRDSYSIPESVTTIGYQAFVSCRNLKSVTIPDSVKAIEARAFAHGGIESLVIPDSVEEIGNYAFLFSDIVTAVVGNGVSSIGNAFAGCNKLESITIGDNVSSIWDDAFAACVALKTINVSEKNEYYCSDNGVLFSKDKTALVTFPEGYEAESYTVPNSVTTISYGAFENCDGLVSIDIPVSVKEIGAYAFNNCTSLREANYNGIMEQWYEIRIGDYNESLDNATIKCKDATMTPSGYCGENAEWKLENGKLTIFGKGEMYRWYNNLPWKSNANAITEVVIEDGITYIGSDAFSFCSNLRSVTIPESVYGIYDGAFQGCSSLESIAISANVSYIGDNAFGECPSLAGIEVNENNKNYCSDGGVLYDKDKTTLIAYPVAKPDTEFSIPEGVVSVKSSDVFSISENLEIINIPASMADIGSGFYFANSNLKEINVDEANANFCSVDGVLFNKDKTQLINYPYGKEATTYRIPDGVEQIGSLAFRSAVNLKSISIPVSVTFIDEAAFNSCPSMTDVYYGGTEEQWSSINICDWNYGLYEATIHYNSELHTHNYDKVVVTEPTCTEGGYTTHICECGDSYVDNEKAALGHDRVHHEAKAATCTEKGWEAYDTCTRCDYTTYKEIAATGHTHEAKVTAPTCTDEGYTTYVCHCGDSYVDEDSYVEALGHDIEHHDAKAPTCTEAGWKAYDTCSRCDYTTYEKIAATGHDYSKGVCTVCGAKDPNYVPSPEMKITTSSGHPKVTWNKVDGAAKYWVYRSTDGVNFSVYTTVTDTSYTNLSTTVGTTYYYKVKAVKVVNGKSIASDASNTVSIKCVPSSTTISMSRVNGKPKVTWNAVDGATKYWLYRSTDGVNFSVYATVTGTSFKNDGAASGTTYYYKVRAVKVVNGTNAVSASSNTVSLFTSLAAPSVKITTVSGHPRITWSSVSGADKYYIYRSTDGKNFSYYDSTTGTSYTNLSTKIGTTYYYKVKAIYADNSNANSALSSAKSIKCVPAATTVSISSSNGKPKVTWTAVDGATKYWLYRSTDGVNFTVYDTVKGTSYTNLSAKAGTTYYYKVKAVKVVNGTNVSSSISNTVSLKAK